MSVARFCDLDNTIIFSHRHEIAVPKVYVEFLNGKQQAYMKKSAYEMLQVLPKDEFIPVTSRTISQFKRIRFYSDESKVMYSLVDNGGLLLINGEICEEWKNNTINTVWDDLVKMRFLNDKLSALGDIKWQDDLVVFIKPFNDDSKKKIYNICEDNDLLIFNHGNKLYICSKLLNKGYAVKRFLDKYMYNYSVAAGDSFIDLKMGIYVDKMFINEELDKQLADSEYYKKLCNKISTYNKFDLADAVLGRKVHENEIL